jgi:putative DNA primase/helicase
MFENIPTELCELDQWVLWRYEFDGKAWTKVPRCASEERCASTTDRSTWSSFVAVQDAYAHKKNKCDGIGFVFSAGDPYFGADFDHCIKDQKIDQSVLERVEQLDSYTEKSVSGTGLHVIGEGLVGDGIKTGNFELYDRGRYFTFSGRTGRRNQIEYRQAEVEAFKRFLRPSTETQNPIREVSPVAGPSVHAVLEKAFSAENGTSLRALYEGGLNGHKSHSEAIASLCWKLAFWTDRNPTLLDAVIRGSRLVNLTKWDSRRGKGTWGAREIDKAIAKCTEFFDWNRTTSLPSLTGASHRLQYLLKRPSQTHCLASALLHSTLCSRNRKRPSPTYWPKHCHAAGSLLWPQSPKSAKALLRELSL